ncbi:MAG: DUF5343 domain-containing protein [Chloroflexi bacterium]|nr:DUF5343 domain-containing protein [Chloroflexota bacterium]
MVNEDESLFRPYAPPANIQALLNRLRRMNMPPVITREVVKNAGISENIVPRVVRTLLFLDLITDAGEPTNTLRALVSSAGSEYQRLLEKTIRIAYAEDFQRIDPSQATQERIESAFQRYTPMSQHGRQVMLFLGLCREAGIAAIDVPRRRGMRGKSQSQRPPRRGMVQRSSQQTDGMGPQSTPRPGGQRAAHIAPTEFFVFSLEDAAYMPEEDFREVWSAVGTVFLRRAQRIYLTPLSDTATQIEDESVS